VADEIRFEWDQANVAHIARHGVTPEEAQQALTNEPIDFGYQIVDGEERWTSLGHTNKLRILKVVWTVRGDLTKLTRVVTAVGAPRNEARAYLRAKTGL
jgi:uncharacterized DUF497 family protein